MNVNALHVIYTAKALVNQLVDRYDNKKKKSGLIVVSTGLAAFPVCGLLTYSASKSLATFIGEGLNYELEGKVDVLSY